MERRADCSSRRVSARGDTGCAALPRGPAGDRAGVEVAAGGWWFPESGWLQPASLVAAQLAAAGAQEDELKPLIEKGVRSAVLQAEINRLGEEIRALGAVNLAALEELRSSEERKSYLDAQSRDLSEAMSTLEDAIRRIDRETRERLADACVAGIGEEPEHDWAPQSHSGKLSPRDNVLRHEFQKIGVIRRIGRDLLGQIHP